MWLAIVRRNDWIIRIEESTAVVQGGEDTAGDTSRNSVGIISVARKRADSIRDIPGQIYYTVAPATRVSVKQSLQV